VKLRRVRVVPPVPSRALIGGMHPDTRDTRTVSRQDS
jgi:hypothetical protein